MVKLTNTEVGTDQRVGGYSYPDSGISSTTPPLMDMTSSNVDTDQAMVFSLTDIDTTQTYLCLYIINIMGQSLGFVLPLLGPDRSRPRAIESHLKARQTRTKASKLPVIHIHIRPQLDVVIEHHSHKNNSIYSNQHSQKHNIRIFTIEKN